MSTIPESLAHAKGSFAFLSSLGFRIRSEHVGTSGSFKDGFALLYAGGDVTVLVETFDLQLRIVFAMGDVSASWLFLDHQLRGNASGFAGDQFSGAKLLPALDTAARDIEAHDRDVLAGAPETWRRIERLVGAPRERTPYLP